MERKGKSLFRTTKNETRKKQNAKQRKGDKELRKKKKGRKWKTEGKKRVNKMTCKEKKGKNCNMEENGIGKVKGERETNANRGNSG